VVLDGSAADADDPYENLSFSWFVSDESVTLDDPTSPTASGDFPVGVTMATLTVVDGRGGYSVCDATITVQDTTPPEVMCTTNVAALWPPKHDMRQVELIVSATDACSDPGSILPLSVVLRSSEMDNAPGGGDGNTTGDTHGYDGYLMPVNVTSELTWDAPSQSWRTTVFLRAERLGSGNGRKYTIDVTAADPSGNAVETSCVVVVPHDKRGLN
jgi:hypothetical protein